MKPKKWKLIQLPLPFLGVKVIKQKKTVESLKIKWSSFPKNQEDIESLPPKFITKELTGATVESGTAMFYCYIKL